MATFTNQATLSYNNVIRTSNVVTGELIETVGISKTSLTGTYTVGEKVTYLITLTNNGTEAATDITVTDDLGAYTVGGAQVYPLSYVDGSVLYMQNGTIQTAPTVTAQAPLTVTGITVPAGGNATLVYETTVTHMASPEADGTVTNTASASGEGITGTISAAATVTNTHEPVLAITKNLSPIEVSESGQIIYTFVIENYGNTEATSVDNVALTDTFAPVLTNLAVTYNGTVWADPANYTYTETSGEFATVPGQMTVPAATYTQNADTGEWSAVPGTATLTVTGTV